MDIKRLTYFCTIVEQGQISRAARFLHISQPLSQRLMELEEELGVQLIVREGHACKVTEAGRVLYERSRQLLNQLQEIPAEVRNEVDGFSGTLRIGSSSTCVSYLLGVMPALHRLYPRLTFRVFISDSTELEDHVDLRDVDFAILLLPVEGDDYVVRALPPDTFSVVVPAALARESWGPRLRVEDLAGLPLVCSRRWRGGGTYDQLIRAFQKQNLAPHVVMDTPDTRTGLGVLLRGLEAAAIFPANEIPAEFARDFRVVPLDLKEMEIHPAVVHLKDRYLSLATQKVIEAILKG